MAKPKLLAVFETRPEAQEYVEKARSYAKKKHIDNARFSIEKWTDEKAELGLKYHVFVMESRVKVVKN